MRGLQRCGSKDLAVGEMRLSEALSPPEPRADQVLVRIAACGVNHADRSPSSAPTTTRITGIDIAGYVAGLGDDVDGWQLDEAVLIDPSIDCGQCHSCRRFEPRECSRFGLLGIDADGGHAEYIAVPARKLHRLPSGLSPAEATAVPLAFATAWRMLQKRARVRSGDTVLVAGASGAIGHAAVQIAALAGCRTVALSSSAWKARELGTLGAARTVVTDQQSRSWSEQVLHATGQRGVDVIIDPVGPLLFPRYLDVIRREGRIVTCGTLGPKPGSFDPCGLHAKEVTILGCGSGGRTEIAQVLTLMALGKLHPIIDRQLPLERADEAYELLTARGTLGKLTLTP